MSETQFTVRRFSDDFADILRKRILAGELKAGERLNEVRLAETYGISRSPIREALQALSGEGLVRFVAGRGAFVGGLTPDEVREHGELREALEAHAARLAATRADAAGLAVLESTIERSDVAPGDEGDSATDFHTCLLELADSQQLKALGMSTIARMRLARSSSATRPGRLEQAVVEHREIYEAIRDGDVDRAGDSARTHVSRAWQNAVSPQNADD